MKQVIFPVLLFSFVGQLSTQPAFKLGTAMDGFGYTDPIVQELKATYNKWSKTAANTNNEFLFHADDFYNKWTADNVSLNTQYTLVWGGGSYQPSNNGTLASVTSGRTYTFKLRRDDGTNSGYTNLAAIVMETSSVPVTLDSRTQSPDESNVHEGQTVTVILTLSATPSSEEHFYLRYTTDNFLTYGTLRTPDSGAGTSTQVFTIPSQTQGTTVHYYLFSSTLNSGLSGDEPLTDLATINFLRSTGLSNFSYTVLGPLPVELVSFDGYQKEQNILLTWRTASEQNNAYFDIQRSTDGRNWASIGEVAGRGTTLEPQLYSFTDRQPLTGKNYYRLRQVDFNGAFEYSSIVSVEFKPEQSTVAFYPNPVSGDLFFTLPSGFDEGLIVRICDLNGRLLIQKQLNDNRLTVSELPPGVYFVKLETEERQVLLQERLVKD